jgi:hypothetical protein
MTGTFPFLKQVGGHNTAMDLAIAIPAAIGALVAGPEVLAGLGGLGAAGAGAAGAADVGALGAGAAFADPTAAALAGEGLTAGAGGFAPAAAVGGAAAGAPGASAALGFGGDIAAAADPSAAAFLADPAAAAAGGLPADASALTATGAVPYTGATMAGDITGGLPGAGGVSGFDPYAASAGLYTVGGAAPAGAGAAGSVLPAATAAATDPAYIWGGSAIPGLGASEAMAAGAAPAGAVGPGIMDTLGLSGATNFMAAHPLLTLGGLSVGGQLLAPKIGQALGLGNFPQSQQQQQLAQQEQQLAQQQQQIGTELQQPLLTGQLPPGQQEVVAKALQDAISTIKGRYASLGLTGSTMEADAIANAQNQSTVAAAGIEQTMAQTGTQAVSNATQALQLEAQVYNTIMNAQIQQDQQLGNAISGFANAAALGTALQGTRAAA